MKRTTWLYMLIGIICVPQALATFLTQEQFTDIQEQALRTGGTVSQAAAQLYPLVSFPTPPPSASVTQVATAQENTTAAPQIIAAVAAANVSATGRNPMVTTANNLAQTLTDIQSFISASTNPALPGVPFSTQITQLEAALAPIHNDQTTIAAGTPIPLTNYSAGIISLRNMTVLSVSATIAPNAPPAYDPTLLGYTDPGQPFSSVGNTGDVPSKILAVINRFVAIKSHGATFHFTGPITSLDDIIAAIY